MVEKSCRRSQGQPVSGVRRAAMISRRREISRDGVITVPGESQGPYQTRRRGEKAWAKPLMAAVVRLAAGLEQEPGASLGLVEPDFQHAGGGHVVVLLANLVRLAHGLGDRLIVGQELAQHIDRRDEILVIVLDA